MGRGERRTREHQAVVGRARMAPQLKPAPKVARRMGLSGGVVRDWCHSAAAMRSEAEEVLP